MQPQARYEDSKQFYKDYWYTPYQLVTVVNPLPEDYYFKVEGRSFVVKTGTHEDVPGTVANVYLSRMAKLLAQKDRKFKHFVDWNLRAAYYNLLIVNVKNLMQDTNTTPSYLQDMPQTMQTQQQSETPPWMQTVQGSGATGAPPMPQIESSEQAVSAPPIPAPAPLPKAPTNPPAVPSPQPTEFEHAGSKYRQLVNVKGITQHYKDGKRTSKAEFETAANAI